MKNLQPRHRGFMLVEVLLAISIIVAIASYNVIAQIKEAKVGMAREYGKRIAEYTSAVRGAVSTNGAGVIIGGSPRLGVDWLKTNDGSCPGGGSAQPFLPCSFRAQMVFGIDMDAFPVASQTTITSNGLIPPTYSAVTLFPPITASNGDLDLYLTHIAHIAALNYDNYDRASTGFGTAAYEIDPVTGVITTTAVADSGADVFLRRDGTNDMVGSLNMGANQDIINAGNITSNGDLNIEGSISNPSGGAVSINDADGLAVTGETTFINDVNILGNQAVSGTSDLRGDISNSTGDLRIDDSFESTGTMRLTNAVATHEVANVLSANDIELESTTLNGVNATLSGTTTFSGVFLNNQTVPKPVCNSANNSTPQIFVQPAVFHANGDPMYGVAAYAISAPPGFWTIKVETMDMSGTMVVTGKASAFIKCS